MNLNREVNFKAVVVPYLITGMLVNVRSQMMF